MKIIVGLGNPGKKYQFTRHNIGFLVVEEFAKKNDFPKFKFVKKFNSSISEGSLNSEEIIAAKPGDFMNLSGKSVKLLTKGYKLKPQNLIIVHDDIDLPLGKIKIAIGRGSAGHKGVESIIKDLKTKSFIRFRVGIKSELYTLTPRTLDRFVLQKFNRKEKGILSEVIRKTVGAIEMTTKERVEKAMAKYNQ